ncbi:MAG: SOS response-associated peptidase [Gammaproteobacteria bacterium]|nr:SOS response-associated peptidase [Gammaproteobacteria bacterium]
MCGRFTRTTAPARFAEIAGAVLRDHLAPSYNIAPTQKALVVREHPESGEREMVALRWGLIPHWANDAKFGARTINARTDTVATKPAFRDAFKRHRCLVATDGWYEWRVAGKSKIPTYIRHVDAHGEPEPVFFGGLWSHWYDPAVEDAHALETFTVLTREASPALAHVHDRMPFVIAPAAWDAWLDRRLTDRTKVEALLEAALLERYLAYPVSTYVNSPRNDGEKCVEEVREQLS